MKNLGLNMEMFKGILIYFSDLLTKYVTYVLRIFFVEPSSSS